MNPLAVNLIRTYVPVLVGAVASWLTARGIHLQPQQTAWAVATLTATFSAGYYTVVRVLEERFPAVGPLLLLSRPAASLHVVADCPAAAEAEDYGEGWPPRDDYTTLHPAQAPAPVSQAATPARLPVSLSGVGAPLPPLGTTGHLTVAQPVVPEVPPTRPEPLRVRKADTGAIPVYRTPPGR